MGSSATGKKHKKEKKHKHRSDNEIDLTGEGVDSNGQRRHKHRRHKEQKERHKHKHHSRERLKDHENVTEVIAVQESDSDSSDCVEVPVDTSGVSSKRSRSRDQEVNVPPPPQLSRRELDRERERERERERDRYERERDRGREQERYVKERERRDREDRERDREHRERYERERERERNRDRERERDRSDRSRHHERNMSTHLDRERERDRSHKGRSRSRSNSPIPENGAGDVLSIQETNKLRAKLGLKPLEIDSGPSGSTSSEGKKQTTSGSKDLSKYKDEWGEFLHKPADNLADKTEGEKLREKLLQRREKRILEERLALIRGLGESDEETDNVNKWVSRNKQIVDSKKEAEKRAQILEEMDAEIEASSDPYKSQYGGKDLKGLRVEHDMEEFTEGKTVILTLKDKEVLNEEDGDTLVNVNLIDEERYRKNVKNKKLNPLNYGYNVYEEQYDMLGNPIGRSVLEKYDEDVDGKSIKNKKSFVLGENSKADQEQQRKLLEIKTKLAGKKLETLADSEIRLASDILSEAEMARFKKPKKKVKKLRQKLKAEDLLPLVNEPLENHLGTRNGTNTDLNIDKKKTTIKEEMKIEEEDASELERMLSKARKLKQKENLIQKPLAIDIELIKQEIKAEPDEPIQLRSADGNIILNSTAEFCRTLGDIPTYGMAGNRIQDGAEIMDYELDSSPEPERQETVDYEMEKQESSHGTWNSVNPDEVIQPADLDNIAEVEVEERAILDEEPDVGAGVANALRLALSKGYLEKEEHNRPSNSKMAHLQAKNYSIEDKSTVEDEKFGRRDRFHSGPIMDFKEKDGFKPNVKLEYIDDSGRILSLKEAFRYLSHKFHGKGPGKNKIEKRLKKMEQEGLMKTMSSTDTPLGTLTMLQQKQKETKIPYVVLSGGKQAANSFGSPTLSKYK